MRVHSGLDVEGNARFKSEAQVDTNASYPNFSLIQNSTDIDVVRIYQELKDILKCNTLALQLWAKSALDVLYE